MNKLISVITPTHNRAKTFLEEAILSVSNQMEDGFSHEHIIVDNKSTDHTRKLVQSLAKKDRRIKYIHNPRNLGAADAMNVGFDKSKGDLIVPFDDDDLLPRFSLQFRWNYFQNNKKAKWTYGHLIFIDDQNKLLKNLPEYNIRYDFKKDYFHSLLIKNFIPGGSSTFRREIIKKVGGWNSELMTQDFDMSLKLAHAGFVPYKIDSYLYYYRLHPKQAHKQQIKDGIYAKEWEHYINQYNVDTKLLNKLSKK